MPIFISLPVQLLICKSISQSEQWVFTSVYNLPFKQSVLITRSKIEQKIVKLLINYDVFYVKILITLLMHLSEHWPWQ